MAETADVQALFQQGLALHQKGALAQAEKIYRQVLAQLPVHFDALHLLGVIALQAQAFDQAIALIDKALATDPNHPSRADAHVSRGAALRSLKRFEDAVVSYSHALAVNPHNTVAHFNRAAALRYMGRHEAAIADYNAVIALQPGDADAIYNRGLAQVELEHYEAALASFEAVMALQAGHAPLYRARGDVLRALKRHHEAIASYDKALGLDTRDADAHRGRGLALFALSDYRAALESYDKAVALNPQSADIHYQRGLALARVQHYQKAVDAFDAAIALKPAHVRAYVHRGTALAELSRPEAALVSFDKAIALNSGIAPAHHGRANALASLKRYEEAIESYDTAFAYKPGLPFLQGARLHTRLMVCDWRNFAAEIADIGRRMELGEKPSPPFVNLCLIDSPQLQRRAMDIYKARLPVMPPLPSKRDGIGPKRKIRIGYFSADFREHAVGLTIANLIEVHDREAFEIYGFSFGPATQDETRKRLERAFDIFVDVADDADDAVAQLARERHIDIAVDLTGFTGGCRPGIFAKRAAPLQVNYLGYPGTTGSDAMDYIIADWTVIPAASETHYSEKIARLPANYLPIDSTSQIAEKVFTRAELGLPSAGFVFCCFNNSYKITPDMFDVWMRILKTVEGSVLWLREHNAASVLNLRAEAARTGVAPERLIFAPGMSRPDHLARHRAADLFLDTLPYNAHSTGSDALWTGLPVLTCTGESFAARVVASLLNAAGLPELVTTTLADYEALAVSLAGDGARLALLKQKLTAQRLTAPLFDISAYARNLETLYTRMIDRDQAGLPPAHIDTAH